METRQICCQNLLKRAEVPAIKKAAARMGLEEGEREASAAGAGSCKAVEKAVQEAGDTEKAEKVKKALTHHPPLRCAWRQAVGLIENQAKEVHTRRGGGEERGSQAAEADWW